MCELQVHGGPAVISALYAALRKVEGFRLAEAGEFSKRWEYYICNDSEDIYTICVDYLTE